MRRDMNPESLGEYATTAKEHAQAEVHLPSAKVIRRISNALMPIRPLQQENKDQKTNQNNRLIFECVHVMNGPNVHWLRVCLFVCVCETSNRPVFSLFFTLQC